MGWAIVTNSYNSSYSEGLQFEDSPHNKLERPHLNHKSVVVVMPIIPAMKEAIGRVIPF
jgi:hypothetical protein